METASFFCIRCDRDLREVGTCCDESAYEDGSHDDGICVDCCPFHSENPNWFKDFSEENDILYRGAYAYACGYYD